MEKKFEAGRATRKRLGELERKKLKGGGTLILFDQVGDYQVELKIAGQEKPVILVDDCANYDNVRIENVYDSIKILKDFWDMKDTLASEVSEVESDDFDGEPDDFDNSYGPDFRA